MSKESTQRPTDQKKFNDNWEKIFGKKKEDKKDGKLPAIRVEDIKQAFASLAA